MTSKYVRTQIEKVSGRPMQQEASVDGKPSRSWFAKKGTHTISFIDQDGRAICLHVRRTSQQADPISDYYPGSFFYAFRPALECWVQG